MKEGIEGLLPKSKRPKNPRKISDEIKRKVIEIRKRFRIGCEKSSNRVRDISHNSE